MFTKKSIKWQFYDSKNLYLHERILMTIYSVKSGDSLYTIAKANNATVPELLRLNPKIKNNIIYPKQQITLPDKSAGFDVVSLKKNDTINSTTPNKNIYIIRKGDNFEKIEKQYWLKSGQIKSANPDLKPEKLKIGQKINIPEKELYIKPVNIKDKNFDTILSKILKDEGGFKPTEKDGSDTKTNKGITQEVYNQYLKHKAFDKKQKSFEIKDVKNITEKELKEIYYNYYYLESGADKEKNKKTAYWIMDTAVNCGVKKAKELKSKCGNDNEKWFTERNNTYNKIVQNNSLKKKYLNGWINRISRIKNTEIT